MKDTVRQIRRRFIIAAMLISVFMVLVITVSLNLMMNYITKKDTSAVCEMIANAVEVGDVKENSVTIELDQMPTADFDLPYAPDTVSKVLFYGTITNTTGSDWYCGGSDICYYGYTAEGNRLRFSRAFAFNKDNTAITVDFEDMKQITGNYKKAVRYDNWMYISSRWWTSSARSTSGVDTELIIDRIKIVFKDGAPRYIKKQNGFSDLFDGKVPDVVSAQKCFYVVRDNGETALFNSGNSGEELTTDQINELDLSSDLKLGSHNYSRNVIEKGGAKILVYVDENSGGYILSWLTRTSVIAGVAVLAILFVIILIYSRSVAKPAEEAIARQRRFVSEASHELKTPVTIISANADLLHDEIGDNRWLDSIRRQSDSMAKLVKGLLDLSKNEESASKENFVSFDLSRTVTNTILSFDSIAFEQGRMIESDIAPDITYEGIEQKISQLVGILVDNAVKYSDENTEIFVSLTQASRPVLTVTNVCQNFDASKKQMLFERFYRNDESHSSSGYGLGLPIAASIAHLHGADISVEQNGDKVIFTVTF